MTDCILIQARTGSKRFKNKVLKKIHKKTILEIVINRLQNSTTLKNIYVLTSKKKNDTQIVNLCKKIGIKYFRGSENDVVKRYYDCVKKHKIKNIIRITADCPLIDPKLLDQFYRFYKKKNYDYVSNTTPPHKSTFPDGSDIEIFSAKALSRVKKYCKDKVDKEHLTNFIWKDKKFKIFTFKHKKNLSNYRYSLDYKQDFHSIKKIFYVLKKNKQFGYTDEIIKIINNSPDIKLRMELTKKLYKKNRKDHKVISIK